ncbi:MAG: BlaI/MecI/CopY family transcriptional regulator [Ruminococcaceae bacterium]|nr:BlaI/MecI/CopY family transcriptional regulator [Oscillospiraceae bacterium]
MYISLSEGEWKIMKVLWKGEDMNLTGIVKALEKETGWQKATVFVMLKRLIAKGAVRLEENGSKKSYFAAIKKGETSFEETESFLSRVYDGSIGMMVSALAGHKALSEEDIAELRAIIDDAEKKRKE